MRLAIVLEKTTGYPVWFDVIPLDVGDLQAAWQVMTDVSEALDLETDSLALDSAYVSEDLAEWIHQGTEKSMIARLPDRMARSCGFRNREVWEAVIQESCQFRLNGHVWYGRKIPKKIYGFGKFCSLYAEQETALRYQRDFLEEQAQDGGKEEPDFLILFADRDAAPGEILAQYLMRQETERSIKSGDGYSEALPLRAWTDQTVRGKILLDGIEAILDLQLRREILPDGMKGSQIIGKLQSLMCCQNRSGKVIIEQPNRLVRDIYRLFSVPVPAVVDIAEFRKNTLGIDTR